jgi:hypothetical protein
MRAYFFPIRVSLTTSRRISKSVFLMLKKEQINYRHEQIIKNYRNNCFDVSNL